MLLAILNGNIYQGCIFWFLRRSQNERRICSGVLGVVFLDCSEIARVADNSRARSFELFERVRHDVLLSGRR